MKGTRRSTASTAMRAEDLGQLTELSPEDRARLLGENFDLSQALANKQARRRLLAKLSAPEKMHILQEMMKSSQLRRGSRRSATMETPPPRFFGGRATVSGTNYEARVAALLGTRMLADGGEILWEDVLVADLSTITMQAAEPVDDIVLARKGTTAKIFFSAKSRRQRVPLTQKSPAFAEVIDAFVRQFLKLNPADRQTCWFAWAIPPTAGEPAARDLRRVLDIWRMCDVECPLQDFLDGRAKRERTAFERLLVVAEESWQKVVGSPPDEPDMRAFSRRMRVEVFDFDSSGGDADRAKGILADSVLLDPGQAADAWDRLVGFFNEKNEYGTPVTLTLLRKTLTKARIALKPRAGFAEEIARLRELTSGNYALLAAHDTIQPGADPDKTVHVNRTPELNALRATVGSNDLLITGEPGSGKSGLMHSLAHACMENAVPVVLLLAEQISGRDWKGAANLPGFDRHSLDEILANWPSDVSGILLTDALDAVRDPDAQRMLRGLLNDVKRGRSGWKVVASVREFDLEHGQELREMFPGVGVSSFTSSRFDGVAHFHVPRLSDEQLNELIRQHGSFRPFIDHANSSPKSENLHRSPFYLRLAAELMRAGISPERVADWASPAILLRKYWEERVLREPHSAENKQVLRAICEKMVQARSTVISEQDVPLQAADFTGIKELRGRGVLQSSIHSGGVLVGDEVLGFTHHLLHDYAIATALIPKHPPQRLVAFVAGKPLLPVFYRQSYVFALEALWDAEGNGRRHQFWSTALQLEAAPALHSITRIVAPVLAARRVEGFGDLQPLVKVLATESGNDTPSHRALRHLISGLQDAHPDAVRAGAEGWLRFAVELTKLLPANATVEWPLTLLLDHLNSLDERQPLPARGLLNDAGRNLLGSCLAPANSIRQRYTMNVSIVAVCQSFNASPAESRLALLALLTPDRLARFPHRELSQLAHKLKYLGGEGNEIVRQLFEAVFTREKKPGEWEERGSVLMSMRFQTSDQWNSIRHTLADYYKTLGDEDADFVTELACIVLNDVSHRSVDPTEAGSVILTTIPFRGVMCNLVEDFASFRGYGHEPDKGAIASRFEEHLRVWAAANDQSRLDTALDRFARCNHNSSMWSTLLEIGAEYPDSLGAKLETILSESVFQIHEDYRYAGVELFRALHQSGDQQRRQRLEQLILTLPGRYRPWRDAEDALVERWITAARKRLLGVLRDANIVLEAIKTMKADLETVESLPANERPAGFESYSHTYTDEELMEERGIKLSDETNKEMFRLRGELKHFLRHNNHPANPPEIERLWPVIDQSEQILASASDTHSQMARELWGYLVGASANTVAVMDWSAPDTRWLTIRRILLKASADADPVKGADDDGDKEGSLSWGWPAPRIDAAEGLPWIAFRIRAVDESMAAALRLLSSDHSNALRHNLTRRLSLLRDAAPALMWELLEMFAVHEPRFNVLTGTVESLSRLWTQDEKRVLSILAIIAERALVAAPVEHQIHASLAGTHLFHHLRTGSTESEQYVSQLTATCDDPRVAALWPQQLHSCRSGGWLTLGSMAQPFPEADVARQRTWEFFFRLLSAAQTKLGVARAALESFGPQASLESEPVQRQVEIRDRLGRLVNDIATQIYFASGAFAEHRQGNSDERLSPEQKCRFWKDGKSCLAALAAEIHPNVAYHLVQTLAHLLPCAPSEIFLLAARSIQTSSQGGGFQYESQAVSEVVKLVQRIFADYPNLLTSEDKGESAVFPALLSVLDLFVEAGWSEARQLTHRLEEIYR